MPVSRDEIILDKSEYSPLDNHLSYYTKQAIVPFFVENGIFRGGVGLVYLSDQFR